LRKVKNSRGSAAAYRLAFEKSNPIELNREAHKDRKENIFGLFSCRAIR
jgi:hypothetical protein